MLVLIDRNSGDTKLYQKHVQVAFSLVVVSRVEGFSSKAINYVGKDAEKVFVEKLQLVARRICKRFAESVPMNFDEAVKRLYNQHKCYACKGEFSAGHKKGHKVRDHCHYTGKFRGALHNLSNLRLKRTRTIPVLFYNLKCYDSHPFVKEVGDNSGLCKLYT